MPLDPLLCFSLCCDILLCLASPKIILRITTNDYSGRCRTMGFEAVDMLVVRSWVR